MNSTAVAVICLAAFALSIFLSYRRKLNTGILSMAFAYLIGCFIMNLTVNDVVGFFPVKILFLLFSVCFFYGYAIQNGTLQIIASHIIYRFRNKTKFLPFILYLLAFFMAVLGASAPAVSSFLAPVCMAISAGTGIHYLIMLVLICLGSGAGSLVPWGQGGLIIRGIVEGSGFSSDAVFITAKICLNLFFTGLIALFLVYLLFKGYLASPCAIQKPEKMNSVQKKTLAVLGIVLGLVLIPTMLHTLFPSETFRHFSQLFDIQMLSVVGAAVCALLRLGNEKKILVESVPWNTIILVCGVCMLLSVTEYTGIFDSITDILNTSLPQTAIGCILVLLGGFMSFFSGAISVVVPLFLPMVLTISADGGHSPVALASALTIGAVMTCTSPFSTAGSFVLSCLPDSNMRDQIFGKQFLLTCFLFTVPIVLTLTGAYNLFA